MTTARKTYRDLAYRTQAFTQPLANAFLAAAGSQTQTPAAVATTGQTEQQQQQLPADRGPPKGSQQMMEQYASPTDQDNDAHAGPTTPPGANGDAHEDVAEIYGATMDHLDRITTCQHGAGAGHLHGRTNTISRSDGLCCLLRRVSRRARRAQRTGTYVQGVLGRRRQVLGTIEELEARRHGS